MESASSLLIMAVVIVASVIGISIIQHREQAKAKLAEKISKYRFRASEASRILDSFSQVPIGGETRSLLLKFIQLNLAKMQQLSPTNASINNSLAAINQKLQAPNLEIDQKKLIIPSNGEQLNLLIKNLAQLGRYLNKFNTIAELSPKVPAATAKISLLITEGKICAYIQQGQKSLFEHNYVNAQQNFQVAQKTLNQIKNKNPRLTQLEKELHELTNQEVHKSLQKNLNLNSNGSENKGEIDKKKAIETDVFGPKKKW